MKPDYEPDYDAMTEAVQLEAVGRSGYTLKLLRNPSEAVKLAAVSKDGIVIAFVKNPSETVCMAAVSEDLWAIQHIKNPSEAVCMAATLQDGWAIQHILKPSEAVQIAAVRQDGWILECIDDPSEAVYCEAVKQDPGTIVFVPKPISDAIATIFLLHHPRHPHTPKEILDRAPEILEAHCAGLGDVYTIGLSMNMTGDELSRTMMEWIENHMDIAIGGEMTP